MTGIDWVLVGAGVLFIGWLVYVMWRVQAWAERDFDRHTTLATTMVNPPEVEARRRHPATRALGAYTGAAAATGWCVRCDEPVIGPLREHMHKEPQR